MAGTESAPAWVTPLRDVGARAAQVEQAALLQAAVSSGFLARCREPAAIDKLAETTGVRPEVLQAAATALVGMGVLTGAGDGRVRVSDSFLPLLSEGVGARAVDALRAASVRAAIFRQAFEPTPDSYWDLDTDARVALAHGAGGDARSAWMRDLVAASIHAVPGWHEILATPGARSLDLGCGIGTRVLATATLYPEAITVGVDRAEDLLELARARGRELGVSDRATFVLQDAAGYRDPDGFDVIWWPQTFFARETRSDALASAYANLRPGGLLVTVDPPRPETDGPAERIVPAALQDLARALWDVPSVGGAAVRGELAQAGFVDVAGPWPSPPAQPYLTARRPTDADG